jgi:molybdate transport system regulatory protein
MTRGLAEQAPAAAAMQPQLKVWVEMGGELALSDYRVRLLEAIRDKGSLADGAAEMGLSYRRAWGKVKELEANLGLKLVESTVGGQGGGSTRLTPEAEQMIDRYNRFRAALTEYAEREFAAVFGG